MKFHGTAAKKEAFLETNVDNTMQDVKKGFAEWDKAIPGQKKFDSR